MPTHVRLDYDSSAFERLMHRMAKLLRKRRVLWVALILAGTYIGSYLFARMYYTHPAGNMLYYVYGPRWPADYFDRSYPETFSPTTDRTLYTFFYPAYWVHRNLWPGGSRPHNLDRSKVDQAAIGP